MSKVLQERGIRGLPDSTKPNPRDQVKSISTTKADSSEICRMGCSPYAISGSHHIRIFSETVPFPRTITQPKGIAESVLVRIGKIIFPIDFIILDILEDGDVPLILVKVKDGHEGKNPAGTLIDIPVFVGKFSILAGFIIIDDEDDARDVVLGRKFFMKYVSCQMVMRKFAHGDKCERMMEK
nr:hypothetical protein [Tanacetum cinerariifolium]